MFESRRSRNSRPKYLRRQEVEKYIVLGADPRQGPDAAHLTRHRVAIYCRIAVRAFDQAR